MLFTHDWKSIIVGKDHASKHDSYLARYTETGNAHVMGKPPRELQARRKDGTEFIVELSLAEIETNEHEERLFCGFVRDLTEMKKKETVIRERERVMTAVINASRDPLFQINERGMIQNVNSAATELLGYSMEDYLGENIR